MEDATNVKNDTPEAYIAALRELLRQQRARDEQTDFADEIAADRATTKAQAIYWLHTCYREAREKIVELDSALATQRLQNAEAWARVEQQRQQLAQLRAANEAADEALEAAEGLISEGVELMAPHQVGRWCGVRRWQEHDAPEALHLLREAHAATEGGA